METPHADWIAQHIAQRRERAAEAVAGVDPTVRCDGADCVHRSWQEARDCYLGGVFASVDRVEGPAMLFDLLYSHRITRTDLPGLVVGVWSAAEWPQASLTVSMWVDLFRLAAYPVPAEPVVLYRGATPGRARGMAWTTDLERAQLFAGRFPHKGAAYVYTITAPPEAILADVDAIEGDGGRREAEIIVDPRMLPKVRRLP